MKYISACLLLFAFTSLFSQKDANIWYFGQKAGLDFNSGSAVPLTNSHLFTSEGSATISDRTTGQLLFYTDGDTIWDKTHAVMQNGTGLWGHKSTTQTAVIIPAPGSTTNYYVFTVGLGAGLDTSKYGGLAYSLVDITLNGGNGAVTTKNQKLVTPTSEKLCAIRHTNGNDIWVMTHKWNCDTFYAYRVTSTGVQGPVMSKAGAIHTDIPGGWTLNYESLGYMKFSPDGSKLALAICNNINKMQLFDFDNTTGIVSDKLSDNIAQPNSFVGPYGISFSPDNTKLYLGVVAAISTSPSLVYQYDLSAGDNTAILASKTLISSQTGYGIGAMQIGPDGRIYVAKTNWNTPTLASGSDYLDVIECPNTKGTGCNYAANALFLGGSGVNQSTLGLPGVIESLLTVNSKFPVVLSSSVSTFCAGDSIEICAPGGFASYQWNNGSQSNCTFAKNTGNYWLSVTDANGCPAVSNRINMDVHPLPVISLTAQGDTLYSVGAIAYQWYKDGSPIDGATDSIYIITQPGNYSLQITDINGCKTFSTELSFTGIENIADDNLSVYPNPSTGMLNISCKGSTDNHNKLYLLDMLAQKVLEYDLKQQASTTLDLSALPKGLYLLQVQSGTQLYTRRILLQ